MIKKFLCRKLARDFSKINLEIKNIKAVTLSLNKEALIEAFKAKIVEEAAEIAEAKEKEELIEELADLTEVIEAFMKICEIEPAELNLAKMGKREKVGGFDDGLYIEHIEVPYDSPHLATFSSRPHKYPPL
jgi:predicted house-cleaning noncanonical NTP pyrophosphatase (MazG superfamily)